MCTVLLLPGANPTAVNKYIIYQKIGFTLSPLRPQRERQRERDQYHQRNSQNAVSGCGLVKVKKCPCLESIVERPTHSLVNAVRYPTEVPTATYKRVYAYK